MENQRLFLAVALSVGVIILFQILFPPPKMPPRRDAAPIAGAPTETAATSPATASGVAGIVPSTAAPAIVPNGESIEVTTSLYRARFNTEGAVETAVELVAYPETQAADSAPVELVSRHSPSRGLFPVDLISGNQRVSTATVPFTVDRGSLHVESGQEGELVFRGSYPGWATLEKRFRFHDGRYDFDIETRVLPDTDKHIDWALMSIDEQGEVHGTSRQDQLRGRVSWGLERFHMDSLSVPQMRGEVRKGGATPKVFDEAHGKGVVRWAGFDERYFFLGILPDLSQSASAQLTALPDAQTVRLDVVFPLGGAAASGEGALLKARAFTGPKDLDVLRSTEDTLDGVLDYGKFATLSRTFVSVLKFFHGITGNWGVAIILLTLAVRGLLFPLNLTSFRSMKKLQALQPEMTQIREAHKDDPMKMQQEMGKLYQRNKVNPLGGCLPMLLQFPVFLGLYYALAQAIELRHAHFALWITDLSERDPYYVTPVIMGATMWLQQLWTPAAGDPTQQMMMRFMPVIFTVSFLKFPSGLVLYWMFSNLVGIAQQWYIRRSPK